MTTILIGIIIGLTLGLTGAGGALVAIPLSITWLGLDLKTATSFSLVAVFFSGFFNFLGQRQSVHWQSVLWILPFSFLGSALTLPLKSLISNEMILGLIAFVSVFGIWSVWKKNPKLEINSKSDLVSTLSLLSFAKYAIIGLVMGSLTTLTGLGGGMILVPLFITLIQVSQDQAVASSQIPISMTALFSLAMQFSTSQITLDMMMILKLVVGILIIAIALPLFSRLSGNNKYNLFKKVFFSAIVIISLFRILGETTLWK